MSDYWGYVDTAYGLCAAVALWLGLGAALRLRRARRAMSRIDPRSGMEAP